MYTRPHAGGTRVIEIDTNYLEFLLSVRGGGSGGWEGRVWVLGVWGSVVGWVVWCGWCFVLREC